MKILTITNYYPPYFIGGYEIACKDSMDFLESKGHEVVVLTSDYKSNVSTSKIQRTMSLSNYQTISNYQKMKDEHRNYRLVKNLLSTYQPDIVYFWSLRGIGLAVIEAVDKANISKIFEIGDFWMQGFLDNRSQSNFKSIAKSFLPFMHKNDVRIDPIICVSSWIEKEMKARYSSTNSYVVYNGTEVPNAPNFEKSEKMHFIFAGRIDHEKGLDLAIKALIAFSQLCPTVDFEFEIYGNGDDEYIRKCKYLAKPILNKVHFNGMVENKEDIYKNMGIFLMPTRMREPFGLVLIEAMARGCVVIATNAYGPKEIIEHDKTGLLFTSESSHELFLQIEKLYKNPEKMKTLHKAGYEHVKRHFSIKVVKPEIEIILLQTIGENT